MKIILSRKGFDSSAGGVPSPLVNGRPVSLPIPTRMPSETTYGDLPDDTLELVCDLTKGRIAAACPCHLDPDLDRNALPRLPGWRGALGQVGAAQSHLANHDVGPGDVFLFWGLFRPLTRGISTQPWRFIGTPEHRIFGWLQVDELLLVYEDPASVLVKYPWLSAHPHIATGWPPNNTVYISRQHLNVRGIRSGTRGFGLFRRGTRLTHPSSAKPSKWQLPSWLNPLNGGVGMTYHPRERWTAEGALRCAARGQEFIADIGGRADAMDWLAQLLAKET